jgi:tellurite resistance protein
MGPVEVEAPMNDLELIAELHKLGLDADSFRAVALLPLVEVAWADQSVQAQERKSILLIAKGHDLLEGRAAEVVETWLTTRPSDETFALGRRVLATLAHRKSGLGADMPEHVTETIVDLCAVVAESAGGLFGVLWTVSSAERRTIKRIAEHLEQVSNEVAGPNRGIVGRTIGATWLGVLDDLDED